MENCNRRSYWRRKVTIDLRYHDHLEHRQQPGPEGYEFESISTVAARVKEEKRKRADDAAFAAADARMGVKR